MGLSPSPNPSRSLTHKRHETTHSHHYDTSVPHLLTPNTAVSGHLANLQSWSNFADFPIENVPPLYCAAGGPPPFRPLLPTRLWNGGNTSSYSQLEMVNHPVSAQNSGHYTYPQCARPDHWDLPIDSQLNREPMRPLRHLGTIPVSTLISSRLR